MITKADKYGEDIDYFLIKLSELKNDESLSHQEFVQKLISLMYMEIPSPCMYKNDYFKTLEMIINNLDDFKVIRHCLL